MLCMKCQREGRYVVYKKNIQTPFKIAKNYYVTDERGRTKEI